MKIRLHVTTLLVLAFGGLVLVSAGSMFFLVLTNAISGTQDALAARIEALIQEAREASRSNYEPLENIGRWLVGEISAGRLDPRDRERFTAMVEGALATMPQADAVTYQMLNGNGYYFKNDDDTLETVFWPPEWRVSRRGVSEEGRWVLRPSAIDGTRRGTFITTARDENGDQIGSVGVRANVRPLSEVLSQDAEFRGQELVRFLLLNNNVVIAHPKLAKGRENERPTLEELGDPYLEQMATGDRFTPDLIAPIEGVEVFILRTEDGNDRVFALSTDQDRVTGGEITIGVHFDEALGNPETNRLIAVAWVGLGLVVGSIGLAILIGRRAAQPILRFAAAADAVSADDLDHVPRLTIGPAIELNHAARAFNQMVIGLQDREKIRNLFGKYVPENVAQLLLTDESAGRPKKAHGTVLFLDLAGFTSMSEQMDPEQLVGTMNAFFAEAVKCIEAQKGVVTQFQGDAVLAVFNDPIADPDHAVHAVTAAIRIFNAVDTETFNGQNLKCRIGINTGAFVAGAVGATQRLSYTVHGDAVNLAARLEQMNKEMGTRLLVSEDTVAEIDGFDFDEVALMHVRGRLAAVQTYTLRELPKV